MKKIRRLQTQGEGPRMLALEPQMNLTHGLTPKRLRGILELADQGDILEQHLLFADMEDRCEHLAAEMGKRKRALLTLDWEILPGRANDARAARIAAAVREQFDAVNGFEDLLMDLADGIGHGFSACEIEWDYRYGLHLPAAFHFRPQSWFQVLREDRNQLRLRNGKPDGEELWPFGWIVHTHRSRSGWLPRCGLFRTVAWAYLIRSYALEANIRYVQVHGLPFRLGKYPPGSREEDRRALYNALRTLGQDAAGIIPQGMDILFETPASSSQDLAGHPRRHADLAVRRSRQHQRPRARARSGAPRFDDFRRHADSVHAVASASRSVGRAELRRQRSAPAAVVPVRYAGGRGHRHVRTGAPGAGLGDEDFGSLGARQAQDPGSRKRKRYIGGLEGVTPSLP